MIRFGGKIDYLACLVFIIISKLWEQLREHYLLVFSLGLAQITCLSIIWLVGIRPAFFRESSRNSQSLEQSCNLQIWFFFGWLVLGNKFFALWYWGVKAFCQFGQSLSVTSVLGWTHGIGPNFGLIIGVVIVQILSVWLAINRLVSELHILQEVVCSPLFLGETFRTGGLIH